MLGPCPLRMRVSGGSVKMFSLMLESACLYRLCGTRPMEPANMASPMMHIGGSKPSMR